MIKWPGIEAQQHIEKQIKDSQKNTSQPRNISQDFPMDSTNQNQLVVESLSCQ